LELTVALSLVACQAYEELLCYVKRVPTSSEIVHIDFARIGRSVVLAREWVLGPP